MGRLVEEAEMVTRGLQGLVEMQGWKEEQEN